MEIYKINFNKSQNGFYARYGATSINRKSNLYKNGKTKGQNVKETKLEKQAKYSVMLKNANVGKSKGPKVLYA